jgi:hypothetical protein
MAQAQALCTYRGKFDINSLWMFMHFQDAYMQPRHV